MKSGTLLAIVIFSLVALAHFLRLVTNTAVLIGDWSLPMWLSVPAVIIPAGVAILLFRESRDARK